MDISEIVYWAGTAAAYLFATAEKRDRQSNDCS